MDLDSACPEDFSVFYFCEGIIYFKKKHTHIFIKLFHWNEVKGKLILL